jgi:basic membrane protein A
VTIFMDGFVDGVAYYNQQKGADVQVLGWDKAAQNGSFTGDFEDQNKGRQLTQNFISQGADVVLPVAGPVGLGAAAAAEASGTTRLIWVDSDGTETAPQYADLFLSSVLKRVDNAVQAATSDAVEEAFGNEPYVGTIENEGVGLAELSDDVPEELAAEIEEVRQGIVDGAIAVESPSSPSSPS